VREGRRADVAEIEALLREERLGVVVGPRAREELARRRPVGGREIGHGHDLHVLDEPGVAHPPRRVTAQRDVARAQEGAAKPHFHPPSRASWPKTSSRMPSAVSAVLSAMLSGGFTRKDGL